jgi:hypothetical protein
MELTEQETRREQEIFNQAKEQAEGLDGDEFLELYRFIENIHAAIIMQQLNTYEFDYERYCRDISLKPLSKEVVENWHQYQYQRNWGV